MCNRLHQNVKYYYAIDCIESFKVFRPKVCIIKNFIKSSILPYTTPHHPNHTILPIKRKTRIASLQPSSNFSKR